VDAHDRLEEETVGQRPGFPTQGAHAHCTPEGFANLGFLP
jgi:hypothetical protein